jgi:hypothetical protein
MSYQLCPVYDKTIIQDYNAEGFDSVESTEFEPGFGCVPLLVPYVQPLPPDMDPLPDDFVERCRWWMMTEDEKLMIEDKFLKKHNVL